MVTPHPVVISSVRRVRADHAALDGIDVSLGVGVANEESPLRPVGRIRPAGHVNAGRERMTHAAGRPIDEVREHARPPRTVDAQRDGTGHRWDVHAELVRDRAVAAQTWCALRTCGTCGTREASRASRAGLARRAGRTRLTRETRRTRRTSGTNRTHRADLALKTLRPSRTGRTSGTSWTRRAGGTGRTRNAGAGTTRTWRTGRTSGTSRALWPGRAGRAARPHGAVTVAVAKRHRKRIVLTRQTTAGHHDVIGAGLQIVGQADRELVRRLLDQVQPHITEPYRDCTRAEVSAQRQHALTEIRMSALQHDGTIVNAVVMRKRRSSRAQEKRERDTDCLVVWHLALRERDGAPDHPPRCVAPRGAETAAPPSATIRPTRRGSQISHLTLANTR